MQGTFFDTHQTVKHFVSVGFTEEQAEAVVTHTSKLLNDHIATKEDLKNTELALRKDIESMKFELLKWFIGGLFVQTSILIAIVKLV